MNTIPDIQALFGGSFDFEEVAAAVWQYQLAHNPVMREFCGHLGTTEPTFIPIDFFKRFKMLTGPAPEEMTLFESSGTTGQTPSRHYVKDPDLYRTAHLHGFYHFYGQKERTVFALLPHYLERGRSSLVHMVRDWILEFGLPGSGFYLHDHDRLHKELVEAMDRREPILLIGVTYALLDFAEKYALKLPPDAIVMETGGMKGRRKEMIREEVHSLLKAAFGVSAIHSEYGMTELLSQAYALSEGRFSCPPWMKIIISDPWLSNSSLPPGRTGRINIIDLANVHSCSFIRSDDLGRAYPDGTFEVLGRIDHAEMRGCNLMYEG